MTYVPVIDFAGLSAGLLVVRLLLGLGMAAHGSQKLFGWFGGYGLEGTGGFLEGLGFRPGRIFALVAGAGELLGGLLTAVGLLGPVGPALIVTVMVVAMLAAHRGNGFFAADGGVELPLTYVAGALALAFAGPGLFSVDAILGLLGAWSAGTVWATVAVAVVAAFAALLAKRHEAETAPAHG